MKKKSLLFLNYLGLSSHMIRKINNEIPHFDEMEFSDQKHSLKSFLSETWHQKLNDIEEKKIISYAYELKESGIDVLFYGHKGYPEPLMEIKEAPMVLYMKGEYLTTDELALAIVGSRKCTAYGKMVCEYFTKELSTIGITTISGLAVGIDSIVHKTSLEQAQRTIGVLGNGIDIIYPKKNYKLYEGVEHSGAIMSEFPLGTKPIHYNFPLRNRIISGLAKAVLVIEAQEKSGTLITAGYAASQGRDVFAIPGNINQYSSQGTNRLIQDGAKLVMDIDDILNEIQDFLKLKRKEKKNEETFKLSQEERVILDLLRMNPMSADELVEKTGLDIMTINPYLTILEIEGYIELSIGNRFISKL